MKIKVKAKIWDDGLMPPINPNQVYDAELLPCGERFKILLGDKSYTMSINDTGYLTKSGSGSWEVL